MNKISVYKNDLRTYKLLTQRIESKRIYKIDTSILNELNFLYYSRNIGKKQYKRIYRKLFWKAVFSRKTNFRLFNRTGILFRDPYSQLVYLGQLKMEAHRKQQRTPLINLKKQ